MRCSDTSSSFFLVRTIATIFLLVFLLSTAAPVFCSFPKDSSSTAKSSTSLESSVILDSVSLPTKKVKYYTNRWALRIEGGRKVDADYLADKYGFANLGPVIEGGEFYLFESSTTKKKSTRKHRSLQPAYISREENVLWMEQQVSKKRVKRSSYYRRHRYGIPNDPFWNDMWYLHRSSEQDGEIDHNVKEAWDLGYTGRGVVLTILDDGLERTHPDISPNYDPDASYDVNDRDDDPTPRYEYTDENRHGTRCAGEVASVFNNSLCIVGIAFNARIGGIRMLDGDVTDAVEAASLSHNFQHIDIYSASWGPDDDGRTVDGPATLTKNAFERGIREGRQGKGSIFIWASGNGGKDADSCNCDGYTNSIYTLSISSATERGNIPWYSEACSSTLATAYSSGATGEKMIVTTDLHHSCTKSHTGTSASAPLAAGIAALTLEANPSITWRDLQHIVVRTARPVNLRAGDWKLSGVGRNVSHSFGYGLLDAGAMVRLAQAWRNVPRQKRCRASYPVPYKTIPHGNRLHLQIYTNGCAGDRNSQVKYLEHVQAIVTLSAPKRGDIQIYLTSPKGTRSTLLAKRARDTSRTGFRDWAFMTTHNWGEPAYGTWSLEIDNDGWDDAELLKWDLVMYGTDVPIRRFEGWFVECIKHYCDNSNTQIFDRFCFSYYILCTVNELNIPKKH
ncbi:subtilase family domain-containing protein [Ditylenchus destructor]|nr:subtilase family domain-containing protein [Ditylenchus destructor]